MNTSKNNNDSKNGSGADIGALNASANGVLNAVAGMGAIASRIEAAVKVIHSEREKAVGSIHKERGAAITAINQTRDAAIAAVRAATPSRSAVQESDHRNIGGGRTRPEDK